MGSQKDAQIGLEEAEKKLSEVPQEYFKEGYRVDRKVFSIVSQG